MKKKLLTVLLAVVMAFGVFAVAGCSGESKNADADYNYYAVKYEIEGEIAIEAVTFQGVYKMFTNDGKYLLYVEHENDLNSKANMQAINKLALEWGVTIYHFNPDLSGGYAADNKNAATANIIRDFTNPASFQYDAAAASSLLGTVVQPQFLAISKTSIGDWRNGVLVAVNGKESTVAQDGSLKYNGSVAKMSNVDKAYDSIIAVATKRPSYGAYTDKKLDVPVVADAYITAGINTINCFADGRLHMYDEKNDLKVEREDVYVTVANYGMFAHLMDNNEGYFPVFFGGTWCPNTQAIAKLTNDIAKDYGVEKIYFFDPNLADCVLLDTVSNGQVVENSDWTLYGLNTRAADGAVCNYNFLYAQFLNEYLNSYFSEWNITARLLIDGVSYTKMCVPNIMMFNGEAANAPAELVALAEAEYSWANIAEGTGKDIKWKEDSAEYIGWSEAAKGVFEASPYSVYNPIVKEAPEADSSTDDAPATNAPAADSGSPC